jgi:2-dehydropantoate 2-reductase
MRILIIGTETVGSALAACLSSAGHTITSIRFENRLEETLSSSEPYDWIAFAVKSYETVPAIFDLQKHLRDEIPPVATFQHGVGNAASLRSAFGRDRVVVGHLSGRFSVPEQGILAENRRGKLVLAADSPAASLVRSAFDASSIPVSTVTRGDSLEWSRLFVQLAGNATSAILDMAPTDVLRDIQLFGIEWMALREAQWIVDLMGVPLLDLPGIPAARLSRWLHRRPQWMLRPQLIGHVRSTWGSGDPPLLAGLRAGEKQSEAAWFNGAVAQAARNQGRLAPVNHALSLLVADTAAGRSAWDIYRHRPDMLLTAIRAIQ